MGEEIDVVGCLYLDCSEETMKNRIMKRGETSGRSDDNEEVFKNRIKVYTTETVPILEYFEKKNKFFEVFQQRQFLVFQFAQSRIQIEKSFQTLLINFLIHSIFSF